MCRKTGRLKEKTKTLAHGVTEDEALQALYQLKQELKHGSPKADPGRRTTVADFAEQWLEAKAARVRPSVATN